MNEIDQLRKKIDTYNEELLNLLNERAKVALDIGKIKKVQNIPVLDSNREKIILEKLFCLNNGPLTTEMVDNIFTEIMKANKQLQDNLK